LLAIACVLRAAQASDNLASNPGFENATGTHVVDWREYTYGTTGGRLEVIHDLAQARSGNKCVCFDSRRGYCCLMQGWGAPWDPGVYPGKRQQYLVKVHAKGTDCRLLVQLCIYDAKGERPKATPKDFQTEFRFPVTAQWQEYVQPFSVPEGTTHLNLIVGGAAGNKGLLYVDDVGLYDAREAKVRFLPSKERLVVTVDPTYLRWAKHLASDAALSAEVAVYAKKAQAAVPVVKETFAVETGRSVRKLSTESLSEGDHTVQVVIRNSAGEHLGREDDWFEKRIFDWMTHPRGIGPEVPAPYVALVAKDREVRPWGRRYGFNTLGLLECVQSQDARWLQGEMELIGTADGKPLQWEAVDPFRLTDVRPASVRGQAGLIAGNLKVALEVTTEYDGLVRYRLTYGPSSGQTTIDRLRLRVPLNASLCRFYSADGAERHWDPQSKDPEQGYAHDLLPTTPGKVFDSLQRPQPSKLAPTFTGLFWLADYETCFCYAADNDDGWLLRDDAPSVEAIREGETLVLWLNLIDRPAVLKQPRKLEFAFQAGPTKPLPEGWRGIQNGGNPDDAPLTFDLIREAGSGYTLCGATHFLHPGDTPEQRQKSRERIEKAMAGGRRAVGGYHFWGYVAKGFPETRVFRGEWGIDKEAWEANSTPRPWEWNGRFFGENPDLCIILRANTVPSYVDFLTYAYDEALEHTQLSGFYDDTGYLKKLFDEDLGIGYVREDGTKIASSGLWTYRDRWQRVAYVHHKHQRPNYTWDSQHVHAHYLPAYNFIGIWAPCEKGYYNSFPDRDIFDYYGSSERYAAFNPARQFGQMAMVGMSSYRGAADVFQRDTRTMMMLALLHDQDVGSFGNRDVRIVCRLRHARNLFRPWEQEVGFVGYWANAGWVSCPQPDVRVSLYHRPDAALFVVGNVGGGPVEAALAPVWNRWKTDPGSLTAVDAETGERIAMAAGPAGPTIRLSVPRHDVRLVLVAPPDRFPVTAPILGADLPGPQQILARVSDRFAGPELAPAWQKDLHEGTSWAGILDGRLCVQGNSYGYAHVRRELGMDDVSVQCLVMRPAGGGMDAWGPSLFLVWPNGEYVQATPGMNAGKFCYRVSGGGDRYGSPVSKQPVAGWFPHCANWVKLRIAPERIEGFGSSDGRTWSKDWEIKRGAAHAGPPQWVLLGNGAPGKEPCLNNVHPQHFSPKNPSTAFFSDLAIGK
jgi:hypothetical protein